MESLRKDLIRMFTGTVVGSALIMAGPAFGDSSLSPVAPLPADLGATSTLTQAQIQAAIQNMSLASLSANGGIDGGGGNSVVCFDDPAIPAAIRNPLSGRAGIILDDEITNHLKSVQAYDLYEAQMPRGLSGTVPQMIQNAPNEAPRDYVERIAKRFDNYLPLLSVIIRDGSQTLDDNHIIIRPAGLYRINDENDVGYIDAQNCVVATMAAPYPIGNETFLQIDGRLFQHPLHSVLSQSVLFLHESVYNSVRRFTTQQNSLSTRTLIGTIIDQTPIDLNSLVQLYTDLGMPSGDDLSTWPAFIYNTQSDAINAKVSAAGDDFIRGSANQKAAVAFNNWFAENASTLSDQGARPVTKLSDGYYASTLTRASNDGIDITSASYLNNTTLCGWKIGGQDPPPVTQCKAELAAIIKNLKTLQATYAAGTNKALTSSLESLVMAPIRANPIYGPKFASDYEASILKAGAAEVENVDGEAQTLVTTLKLQIP